MSSDAVHAVQGLTPTVRVQALRERVTRLQTIRDTIRADLQRKKADSDRLRQRGEVLTKVVELYRVLMDRMVLSHTRSMETLVTEGFKAIFHDQKLAFRIDVTSKWNRVALEFVIIKGDPDNGGVEGEPLTSFGGGPSSVASLILKVLTLLKLRRRGLLVLDETLLAVSEEYVEQTSKFLQSLATKSNLPTLLITHNHAFADHAQQVYLSSEIPLGGDREELALKRIRG